MANASAPPPLASPHPCPVHPPPSCACPPSSSAAPLSHIASPHPSPIALQPSFAFPTASAASPLLCTAFPHPNPAHPLPSTAAPPPTHAYPHPSPVVPMPSFAAPLSSAVAPPPTSTLLPPPAVSALPQPAAPPAAASTIQYKKLLNEYAQRNEIKRPEYRLSEEPAYRAYVLIDGKTFVSSRAFFTAKEARQDVARVALEEMMLEMKQEGCSLLYEDVMLCKSILNEFASKLGLPLPMYEVSSQVGPLFISTALFCGHKYTGERARSKKDAEQMAARTVIQSILGGSDGTTMSEIIKAKRKLHTAIQGIDIPMVSQLLGRAQTEVVSHGECTQLPFSLATQPTQHQIDYSHEPCANEAASIPTCLQQGPLMTNNEPVAGISGKKKRKQKNFERQKKLLRTEHHLRKERIITRGKSTVYLLWRAWEGHNTSFLFLPRSSVNMGSGLSVVAWIHHQCIPYEHSREDLSWQKEAGTSYKKSWYQPKLSRLTGIKDDMKELKSSLRPASASDISTPY